MEIKDLLLQENNLQLALDIEEAATEVMIEIQFRFWKELEAVLQDRGYQILEGSKYSYQKVEKFHRESRNNRFYGLTLDLAKFTLQERVCFCIKVDNEIYYGFAVVRGNDWEIAEEEKFDKLFGLISRLDKDFEHNEELLGWKHPKCCYIDFDNFEEPDTMSLVKPEERATLVAKLADEIHTLIERFLTEYKASFVSSI